MAIRTRVQRSGREKVRSERVWMRVERVGEGVRVRWEKMVGRRRERWREDRVESASVVGDWGARKDATCRMSSGKREAHIL